MQSTQVHSDSTTGTRRHVRRANARVDDAKWDVRAGDGFEDVRGDVGEARASGRRGSSAFKASVDDYVGKNRCRDVSRRGGCDVGDVRGRGVR